MWSIPLDGGIRGFREVKIGCLGEPALVPISKSHTEKKEEKTWNQNLGISKSKCLAKNNIIEPVCCKKWQKKFMTSYWFEE